MTLPSRAPLFDNRLSYTAGRILPLAAGELETTLGLSDVNVWAQMPGYFFDGEWTRLLLRGGYGLGHGTEVVAEMALIYRNGGFADRTIEAFHHLFGVTQARRNLFPRNRLRVATITADGTSLKLTDRDRGLGFANPSLGVKKRLHAAEDGLHVVAEAILKLPFGSIQRQFATGRPTGLVDIALVQPFADAFVLDVIVGLIIAPGLGGQRVYGMPLSEVQKFLLAAVEWRLNAAWGLVFQYRNQDGIVDSAAYAPLNATTHEFVLGAKWRFSDAWIAELGVIENSVHDANTPDVGVHIGLTRRFALDAACDLR